MHSRAARRLVIALLLLTSCKSSETVNPGPSTRTVTVTNTGTGTGTVTSSPAGINCGTTCSASLSASLPLTFITVPSATSVFVSWSGACTGASTPCTIVAGTSAVAVTAQFDVVTYTLTVALAGTGTGTVTSAPAGISCASDCTEPYTSGTVVTLTAAPAASSTFAGWSGSGCTGTGACVVTMAQAANVTATFTLITNTLTVVLAGNGSGTVTSSPAGINCAGDCTEAYNAGTLVTLSAASATGSTFTGWSGGSCTGSGTCVVTMNSAINVTATFTLQSFTMTVVRAGNGTGAVTSAPAGITCGNDCTEPYNFGTVVTLTAAPAAGSTFTGWSGGCAGTGTCVVTVSSAATITATFTLSTPLLTVALAGNGNGTVTSAPAGISCAGDCSEAYNFGTVVTLTAAASDGSVFAGWSGACAGTAPCIVTMNAATNVSATFNLIVPGWPDSGTRFCTDLVAEIACPGGPVGQDGFYALNVPNYVVIGGRVQDPITGLVWERNPPITGITHAAATAYCDNLTLDGADDWRLPSILELVSITDFGSTVPPFPSSAFPGIPQNSYYWTSTDRPDAPSQAFGINTNYPTTQSITKANAPDHLVRCVRGAPLSGALTASGSGITDNRTKLVWQSVPAPVDLNWTDALAYCEALSLDGRTDWRLPNGKELLSIVDPTLIGPSIAPIFASRPATRFWSSSVVKSTPDQGYVVSFDTGLSDGIGTPLTALKSVRCVR